MPGEVDDAVVVGAAGEFARILFRRAFDQNALRRADHGVADRLRLGLEQRLQPLQAREL